MTQQITMTADETAVYDGADDRATSDLMRELRARAQALADSTGQPVEIYTADGIVADVREPA